MTSSSDKSPDQLEQMDKESLVAIIMQSKRLSFKNYATSWPRTAATAASHQVLMV
jgi:hypothetical protein